MKESVIDKERFLIIKIIHFSFKSLICFPFLSKRNQFAIGNSKLQHLCIPFHFDIMGLMHPNYRLVSPPSVASGTSEFSAGLKIGEGVVVGVNVKLGTTTPPVLSNVLVSLTSKA